MIPIYSNPHPSYLSSRNSQTEKTARIMDPVGTYVLPGFTSPNCLSFLATSIILELAHLTYVALTALVQL